LVRWQRDDVGVVGLVLFVNRCMYWWRKASCRVWEGVL
jgi:hypothetical protein